MSNTTNNIHTNIMKLKQKVKIIKGKYKSKTGTIVAVGPGGADIKFDFEIDDLDDNTAFIKSEYFKQHTHLSILNNILRFKVVDCKGKVYSKWQTYEEAHKSKCNHQTAQRKLFYVNEI